MIQGIALKHFDEHEHVAGWTDIGWWINYQPYIGTWGTSSPFLYPDDKAESTMAKIEAVIGHREKTLDGFTLFQNAKGWQMSCRRHGEPGWDIKIVSNDEAQAVLSMLETSGHPDGPITVRADGSALKRALAAAEAARTEMTAALLSKGAP